MGDTEDDLPCSWSRNTKEEHFFALLPSAYNPGMVKMNVILVATC